MPSESHASRPTPDSAASGIAQQVDQMLKDVAARLPAEISTGETSVDSLRRFELHEFAAPDRQGLTWRREATADDFEMELTIELGRTQISSDDLPELRSGSVISLDRFLNEPVDLVIDGQLIGRGEVLTLDGSFCVRITELVAGQRAIIAA